MSNFDLNSLTDDEILAIYNDIMEEGGSDYIAASCMNGTGWNSDGEMEISYTCPSGISNSTCTNFSGYYIGQYYDTLYKVYCFSGYTYYNGKATWVNACMTPDKKISDAYGNTNNGECKVHIGVGNAK